MRASTVLSRDKWQVLCSSSTNCRWITATPNVSWDSDRRRCPTRFARVPRFWIGRSAQRTSAMRTVRRAPVPQSFTTPVGSASSPGPAANVRVPAQVRTPVEIDGRAPVIHPARSEARNAAASATSSGRPLRPSGVFSKYSSVSPGTRAIPAMVGRWVVRLGRRNVERGPCASPLGVGIGATRADRPRAIASSLPAAAC